MIKVVHHPLFAQGIFKKYPQLFDRFFLNTSDSLKRKYHQTQEGIIQYEGTVKWPLIVGPGFSGATHPGAENTFNAVMGNSNALIYNGDCIYVNPWQHVFAISDAPGMATCSRKLISKLDLYLQKDSILQIEKIINDLDRETELSHKATLSMVCFLQSRPGHAYDKAMILKAGDTHILYGNFHRGSISELNGYPQFIGNSGTHHKLTLLDLDEGDFFILVSDGMRGITPGLRKNKFSRAFWQQVKADPEDFVFKAIESCNRISQHKISDKSILRFGGNDNVSLLLILPENLQPGGSEQSYILGGYIGSEQQK